MKRKSSVPVTPELASYIKLLLRKGLYQHQIAGVLGINQGRVSEVKTGKRCAAAPIARQLPFAFD
jgi:predicted XRE-type DNA-binding protein